MSVKDLVRKNILELKPYSSARHEFQGSAEVFLDANENPYETGYNRYPDPLQWDVKQKIGELKGIDPRQIFLGNGSDEAIDLLMRIFCNPGSDQIIIQPPTYGMYQVCAAISDIEVLKAPLSNRFQPQWSQINNLISSRTKILFICSPNNPSGNSIETDQIEKILDNFPGIVVVDEAYIDFASQPSSVLKLSAYPNLVVLQTFSKAWGLAGVRLGVAFASEEIITILNAVKPPYNVNILTQQKVLNSFKSVQRIQEQVQEIVSQRKWLAGELSKLDKVIKVFPSDGNFLLVRFKQASTIFSVLRKRGIVVRDRSNMLHCEDCLRITVGTKSENLFLLKSLVNLL